MPAETWLLFLKFSYVCPEPVLVKGSFLCISGSKRPFLLTAICLRASEQKISLSGKFIPNTATLLYWSRVCLGISSFEKGNEGSNVLFCPPISAHGGTTTGSPPTASSLRWNMAPIRCMALDCVSPFLRKHLLLKTADSRHGMIG